MLSVSLLAVLSAAPEPWEPAPAPPPTVWAHAGARGWTLCQDVERQASRPQNNGAGDDAMWARRVEQCPHVPEALLRAAQVQLQEAAALDPEAADPSLIFEAHRTHTRRALAWVRAALAEADRRATLPPPEARYYRAYVLVAMGRYDAAARALRTAVRRGDVARWRSDRMAALIQVLRGNLDRALQMAHRGVIDAPNQDRTISRYIRAFVLDRVGAPAEAVQELRRLRREAGHTAHRAAVESVLPMHERLYLRALEHQANGEKSNAIRLWDAYLARPEPAGADKELARRHRAELEPRPAPVGGPVGMVGRRGPR